MFARRQKADLWKELVIKKIMERRRGLQRAGAGVWIKKIWGKIKALLGLLWE